MTIENNKKEIEYLKKLGFKENDDPNDGFWLTRKVKSNLLKNCTIDISDTQERADITVDIIDLYDGYLATIIEKKYSRKKIEEIIEYLEK